MKKLIYDVQENQRVDKFLTMKLNDSRNQIEQLIKKGFVRVNEKEIKKSGVKVKKGDRIEVVLPDVEKESGYKVDFNVEIIYEDDDILVINKPSGVVVHPAPSVKEATLVDWLKHQGVSLSTISGEERHGIVHRIDKETSGALVVAKTNEAHRELSFQLKDKSMGRYYLALITPPLKENIVVEKPIARNPKNRLKMGIVEGGRYAKSAFAKLALSDNGQYELIGAKLFTGRTHQIRVHLASLHRHILGDSLYGFKSKSAKIPRVFLHAYILYLKHPRTKKEMRFVAPLPVDLGGFLKKYFCKESIDAIVDPDHFDSYFVEWMPSITKAKEEE